MQENHAMGSGLASAECFYKDAARDLFLLLIEVETGIYGKCDNQPTNDPLVLGPGCLRVGKHFLSV